MRQLFYLFASILVITSFFPELGGKMEGTLSAFFDLATKVFTHANGTF